MPNSSKWTVLFIVHAVDDQSRYYSEQLFSELLQVMPAPDVRIFVLRNTYDYQDNTNTHAYLWEIKSKGNRRVKERIYACDNPRNAKEKTFGKLNENVNLGSSKVLVGIFNRVREVVSKDYNGNKIDIDDPDVHNFMLFTWDHGFAFGIFDPTEYFNDAAKPIKSAHSTDMLMVKELANAIGESFRKIPILVMMNCWMQSIETNFQLKDCVDCLVAPETSIDWRGYDYIYIINKLTLEPGIEPSKLAQEIIRSTAEKYGSKEEYKNAAINGDKLILCATRPSKCESLANSISTFAKVLVGSIDDKIENIAKARKLTHELTQSYGGGGRPWCFIDILSLVKNLKKEEVLDEDTIISLQKILNPGIEFTYSENAKYEYAKDEKVKDENSKKVIPSQTDLNQQEYKENFIIARFMGKNFTKENIEHGGISICFPNYKKFVKSRFYKTFYSYTDNEQEKEKSISFAAEIDAWPMFIAKAIETNKIIPGQEDTNYRLNVNSTVHIDGEKIILDHILVGCTKENDNGNFEPFQLPIRNFLLNLNVAMNIDEDANVRIDSLIIQNSAFDGQQDILFSVIERGAGGNKTGAGGNKTGAGSGNKTGAGGNKTGAGGNKTGAGGGQLIQDPALEELK